MQSITFDDFILPTAANSSLLVLKSDANISFQNVVKNELGEDIKALLDVNSVDDDENDIFAGYMAHLMRIYDCGYPLMHAKNQMRRVSDELAVACTNSYTSRDGFSWVWEMLMLLDFIHTENGLIWNETMLANLSSILPDLWIAKGASILKLQKDCCESLKFIGATKQIQSVYDTLVKFHVCYILNTQS